MIVYIVIGKRTAGKSTAAKFLSEKTGYSYIEVSGVLTSISEKMNWRGNLTRLAEKLRKKYGMNILAKKIIKENTSEEGIIVSGLRTIEEVIEFKKSTNTILIAIEAPPEVRYRRYLKRENINDVNLTLEEFERYSFVEGIDELMSKLSNEKKHIIDNSGVIEILTNEINRLLT